MGTVVRSIVVTAALVGFVSVPRAMADGGSRPSTPEASQTPAQVGEAAAPVEKKADKPKSAESASRIRLKGDLRVRWERLWSQYVTGTGPAAAVTDAANRDRMRFRLRAGANATVTDTIEVGFELASGDGDPRNNNQTFTNVGSTKPVHIDMAYADWTFAPGARLVLGKQKQPYWRPGQSQFFDNDLNPEGAAVTFARGAFFGSAYGMVLQENFAPDPAARNHDPRILGAQAGFTLPWLSGETRVGVHYYDCGACQGNAPFWSGGNASGNTTVANGPLQVLAYDYNVLMLEVQVGTSVAGRPLQAWGGLARNLAPGVEYDTAIDLGATLGRASDPGTWEVGLLYRSTDKDALFAQLIESDFAGGRTDGYGWGARFVFAPVRNVALNATYLRTWTDKDVAVVRGPGHAIGRGLDANRLMLDATCRF